MSAISPFLRPFYAMLKPAGAACNLSCRYCYYTEKAALYPGAPRVMSYGLLDDFTRQYIEAQPGDAVLYQGNRIVLFYGGNGWSYTRIGRLEGLSLSELADFLRAGKGAVRVTLSLDGSGCTE